MKKQMIPIVSNKMDPSQDRDVQKEIDAFLAALNSYPDRFAKDPALSFERYLFGMTADPQPDQTN